MDHYRFRIGPLLALGMVLMIGACGDSDQTPADEPGLTGGWSTAGCGVARVAEHVTIGGVQMPVTPAKLSEVMSRIDQAGQADFRDSFAGLEVDEARVRAIVYRVPSATFDDFIRRTAEDVCIVVRDTAHTAVDLAYWHDRILADLAYWTHEGIRIVTVGARHDGSGVEIGTRDLARARVELPARYGTRAPLLFVEQGPVRPLTSPSPG
ncbi:MAG TPA: hypothetical protein VGB74_01540 [Actinoplanes sp.]